MGVFYMRKVELALLVKASWILLLSGLIGSCAPSFSPSMPPPNYTGPKAEGPIQKAGQYWIYENAHGRRFTAGAGDLLGELRFPLWVGKSWGYEGGAYEEAVDTTKTRRAPMATDVTCEVLSFKQVTVTAGNFGAFECQCICELSTPSEEYERFCGEWTLWYAPEVKNIIRNDDEASDGSWELVEYQIPGSASR